MLISMSFIFLLGIEISWLQIVGIAFLILFLSVGAPNQPGSIMIGILIITLYFSAGCRTSSMYSATSSPQP